MERTDLAELSRSIEERQARLADTVAELKSEVQPKVVVARASNSIKEALVSLVKTDDGALKPEAIAAAVVAVSGIAAAFIFSRR